MVFARQPCSPLAKNTDIKTILKKTQTKKQQHANKFIYYQREKDLEIERVQHMKSHTKMKRFIDHSTDHCVHVHAAEKS